ncbi:membrane-spanning 4-domains subfamily A member 4D-like isoform X1 [Acipenser oxyrinchus oxyrinchus]|uniref:Membrane-spanning 4-domains subfamily A member 4D-like isoform X1 n=1 Tax=Acipenser oxyrinchus oxyrinchus TaxID=40147 RepID=A0AAD8CPT7_ACIOX|nr:membrane-spanning 4-domains subfamily A member 4D-like isoform X1 [Acipenser oxyrinchus oxyrinchus]KAK1154721.1 membrane-spanning 4-domains subfamily A member 4D-like isoform X1 [Acipenser oxyrinchus oxyrinchus]
MSTSVSTANGMVVVTQIYPQGTENTAPAPAADQRCHVVPSSALCQLSEKLKRFLKGEPRPLGTVQILIGVISIMFGGVLSVTPFSISAATGTPYWTGVLYIISGSLCVAADRTPKASLIKAALGMNVVSSVAAGIAICFYCVDLPFYYGTSVCSYPSSQSRDHYYGYRCEAIVLAAQRTTTGIKSVLLIFSLLQFCVSVSMAAFACKAACHNTYTPVIVVHNSFRAAEVVGQDCESEDAKSEPPPYTV